MNINDYTDGNGNVQVSKKLIQDLINEVAVENFASKVTIGTDGNVTNLRALKLGNVVNISFYYTFQTINAWIANIVTIPTGYRPANIVGATVSRSLQADISIPIDMRASNSGNFAGRANAMPAGELYVSVTYITP